MTPQNDRLRPIDQGVVPITDAGFIHADAAYDVVSASAGYMFRMQDHIKRFTASCDKFGLVNPYTKEETVEILTNLVKLAGLKDAYIWWAVTRGELEDGNRVKAKYNNKFYAFVTPYLFIHGDELRIRGTKVRISTDYIRIPPQAVDPTAKNFHWMDMKLSIFEAFRHGAEWAYAHFCRCCVEQALRLELWKLLQARVDDPLVRIQLLRPAPPRPPLRQQGRGPTDPWRFNGGSSVG